MCGIAGIVQTDGAAIDRGVLERMCAAMRYRGPDDEGIMVDQPTDGRRPAIGLGHVRLKIIDLATGAQPMTNEDETVWVVFNGEIYNFRELRQELEARGHRFRTQSDTEVIVHAYEVFGDACVTHLRGMFAFAVWDRRRQRLLLARDRLGKKPLVYCERNGQFAFASTLRALLQVPGLERHLDRVALHDYLTFLCVPAPRTIYEGISKLPPAHCLSYERGQVRVWRYWQVAFAPKLRITEAEAMEELGRLMDEAVRLRMVSDVPLGALLSGGMDSSTVVALMAQHSGRPVKTFSIGFEESQFNELPYARLVAQRFGTEHHEEVVRPDAVAILPQLVDHYGEPFADSSAIPSFYLARMARRHVTVVLNGDGGDEAFGGYYRHLAMRWGDRYARWPTLVRRSIESPIGQWVAGRIALNGRLNAGRFLRIAGSSRVERATHWMGCFSEDLKRRIYTPTSREQLGAWRSHQQLEPLLAEAAALDGADAAMYTDMSFYLPNDLLVKMDIATMAHALEARSPLLDHHVVEFAARLPVAMKVRGMTLKWLLKRMQRRLLPVSVTHRMKQGFGVPVDAWFRGPLVPLARESLLSPSARRRGVFDIAGVERLLEDHLAGRANYGHQLWTLIMFEWWARRFLDTADGLALEPSAPGTARAAVETAR